MQTRWRFSVDQQCDVDDVNKNKAHNEDTLSTRCWAKLRYRQCRRSQQYKRQYVESMFTRCRFSLECRLCRRCKQEKKGARCRYNVNSMLVTLLHRQCRLRNRIKRGECSQNVGQYCDVDVVDDLYKKDAMSTTRYAFNYLNTLIY